MPDGVAKAGEFGGIEVAESFVVGGKVLCGGHADGMLAGSRRVRKLGDGSCPIPGPRIGDLHPSDEDRSLGTPDLRHPNSLCVCRFGLLVRWEWQAEVAHGEGGAGGGEMVGVVVEEGVAAAIAAERFGCGESWRGAGGGSGVEERDGRCGGGFSEELGGEGEVWVGGRWRDAGVDEIGDGEHVREGAAGGDGLRSNAQEWICVECGDVVDEDDLLAD